jgi:proteasome-associated ATPase
MGEAKKPQSNQPHAQGSNPAADDPALTNTFSGEDLDRLSALQLLDVIASKLPPRHSSLLDLAYLRDRVAAMEEMNDQARTALERYEVALEKLRSPAFRVGTFLGVVEPDRAHVCIGGSDYVSKVDPKVPLSVLHVGERVLCNEAFVVVQGLGFDTNGPVVQIDQVLPDNRLRLGSETSGSPTVVIRSSLLGKEKLKPGLEVRLDLNQRVALEVLGTGRRIDRALERVSELPWSSIGGQNEAVQAIRDTIELPLLHKDLFKRFDHSVPKGFLLHGPPGCGKTLLGKATAFNLRQQIRTATGVDHTEFFVHIKGPEILNMWVGESERQVRDLFSQCRERAAEGQLAFLFIDEAESILGVRRGGRAHSILSTLVPMFCTEMDGIEPLANVVIILASNRADLIDPAILRPGRIDRKIRVRRPDAEGARSIYEIYLHDELPLAEPAADLAQAVAAAHFARTPDNEFLEATYRSGRRDVLYRGDLASGAIIAAVVERAKGLAIKRAIANSAPGHLTRDDLLAALRLEHAENDLFPSTDLTEDWLKLTDFDPENVVKLGPIRPRRLERSGVV